MTFNFVSFQSSQSQFANTQNAHRFWSTDKGTISFVIQPKNPSHAPSSGPGTDVHPKEQDAKLNPEHKKGTKCLVPTPCSVMMLCIHADAVETISWSL